MENMNEDPRMGATIFIVYADNTACLKSRGIIVVEKHVHWFQFLTARY